MKEKTRLRIYYAVRLFKSGIRDQVEMSIKLGVTPRAIRKWTLTPLWKALMGDYKPRNFRMPCQRKNLPLYQRLKKRYFEMHNINERDKVSLLHKHPECNVSKITLRKWRKHWIQESIREVPIQ